jgi:thymidylate synthase
MRSWNIDQKGAGDLTIMSMLTQKVSRALTEKLGVKVEHGTLDGLITDIHIYENTLEDARNIINQSNY